MGKEWECYLKRFDKHAAPTKGMKPADWSMHVLKRTWSLWMKR